MYDKLTQIDIDKMNEELEYRISVKRPEILEEVKLTRSYGDLSENAEYHAAKREKGKNESRIRYLTNMIKTAVIIENNSSNSEVGLFDTVEYELEYDGSVEKIRIMTMLRQNVFEGIISQESPMGKAVMGKKVGDRCFVSINGDDGYYIKILSIVKGTDDDTLEIRKY